MRSTEAGWLDGREVTRVTYDPEAISLDQLRQRAEAAGQADRVYDADRLAGYRTARASDQKRQLIRTPQLQDVPALNAVQLTKINALWPRDREAALGWLSPRQRAAVR